MGRYVEDFWPRFESPQRHKDTEKGGIKKILDAAFLCVFVSLW
jgi:hypothetical protein